MSCVSCVRAELRSKRVGSTKCNKLLSKLKTKQSDDKNMVMNFDMKTTRMVLTF